MSLLPAYMSDAWKCYEQMAREDREAIDPTLINTSPESCHVSVLPFLAWEAGTDIAGLSEALARKVIRAMFDAMPYAGTAAALIGPVEALSETVRVLEWFEYGGTPYNFRVEVDASQNGLDAALINMIEKTVNKQKNARSILESIKASMLGRSTPKLSAATHGGEVTTVYPYFPDPIEAVPTLYMGAAYHTVDTTLIYPQGA